MGLAKGITDYIDCYRTEHELQRKICEMFNLGYRSIEEGEMRLADIWKLLEHAKDLNQTSSCGIIGYIPVTRITKKVQYLEQQLEDVWLMGTVPIHL